MCAWVWRARERLSRRGDAVELHSLEACTAERGAGEAHHPPVGNLGTPRGALDASDPAKCTTPDHGGPAALRTIRDDRGRRAKWRRCLPKGRPSAQAIKLPSRPVGQQASGQEERELIYFPSGHTFQTRGWKETGIA